ncbi:MAG: flagellar hook-basal body protein [Francisellaceae bacterium]
MSDALSIAAAGMRSQQSELDLISNDLANMNTSNYKATSVNFADIMTVDATHLDGKNNIGDGVKVASTEKDFTPGEIKVTNDYRDIAINGDGFFEVSLSDGSLAYTRSSTIKPDSDGYLSTGDGHRLSDNIQIPSDALGYRIAADGEVTATLQNQTQALRLGKITLSKFLNPSSLSAIGNGLYLPSKDSGQPYSDDPGKSGLGLLQQGATEASNVDMVDEMMNLTMAQRAYQLNAKVAQIADEMDKETNELRG